MRASQFLRKHLRFAVLVPALVAAVAVAVATAGLLSAAPAGAAEFHPFEYEIDGTGTTAGQFDRIEDVAVHQSTGTVYVLDKNHHSIDKFDAAGNPQNFSATGTSSLDVFAACPGFSYYQYGFDGIAVDSSGTANDGKIYATGTNAGGLCALNSAGEELWRMDMLEANGACGATTDPLGRLWLAAGGLMQFTAAGEPPTLVTITEPANACRAAVGQGGRLYVANAWYGVERWSVIGPQQMISPVPSSALGLDPDTENIYAANGQQQIDEFTRDGELVTKIGTGPPYELTGEGTIGRVVGIAVRGSTGEVFVADAGSETLKVFGPLEVFPDVTTGSASSTRRTSTTVDGQVTPAGGDVTGCVFEWGLTESYGNSAGCAQATPFAAATSVSTEITGLTPGTTYHYRFVAENANGPNWGADATFTTPTVNEVETMAATAVTRTGATLNGSLSPDGVDAHYYFEWGADESYGNTAPAPPGTDAGSGAGSTPAAAAISGLDFGTTYHYRLVATNVDGATYGDDVSFRTLDAVLGVETTEATDVGLQEATLNGGLDPDGQPTTFYFEWGPTASYGNVTSPHPGDPAGSGTGSTPVSATIEGLTSYTSYHYRLVASNAIGTTYGSDEVVTTAPPLLPTITGTAAAGVSATSASLSAGINPGYGLTVYRFEYGTGADYGTRTPVQGPLGEDGTTHPVNFTVTGLAPGTTYHYRVTAINFSGVTEGPDRTFTTPGPPLVGTVSVSQVSARTAHVEGTVNPVLAATTFRVEYGNGGATGEMALGAVDNAPHAVSTDLGGLSPGTRYRIRVVATNALGTGVSEEQVFTTQSELSPPRTTTACKKGQVKRRGRCVKKRGKRRHHGKRNSPANRRVGTKAEG
jgi:hypothetical protein